MSIRFKSNQNEHEKVADLADVILEKLKDLDLEEVKEIKQNMKILCRQLDSIAKKS
jgi:hypothetical protein